MALDLANVIKADAETILQAIEELEKLRKNAKSIMGYCTKLHDLENEADDVYETYITHLFAEETDSIELIKAKEIMYELEKQPTRQNMSEKF